MVSLRNMTLKKQIILLLAGVIILLNAMQLFYFLKSSDILRKQSEMHASDAVSGVEQNIKTIDEALNYLEGVYNKRSKGWMDSTQRVCIRGMPGSNRVLVLLDNQPLNTGYTGDVPWNLIPIDSVERIEVVRGPSSPHNLSS